MEPSSGTHAWSESEVDLTDDAARAQPAVAIEISAVRAVVELLEQIGDMPSTPPALAEVSRAVAAETGGNLPPGAGPALQGRGAVELDPTTLAAAAGLLTRLGQLASTPPVVADDARSWGEQMWERFEVAEPPAGHRETDRDAD